MAGEFLAFVAFQSARVERRKLVLEFRIRSATGPDGKREDLAGAAAHRTYKVGRVEHGKVSDPTGQLREDLATLTARAAWESYIPGRVPPGDIALSFVRRHFSKGAVFVGGELRDGELVITNVYGRYEDEPAQRKEKPARSPQNVALRVEDLSRRYGVSRSTIWRWAKDGHLPPPKKLGRVSIWFLSQIESWERQVK